MQTRVTSDDYISLNMLFLGFQVQIVKDSAIKFTFIQNIILVYDLNKLRDTPMILADF